jgi:hypothetical protein
MTPPLQFTHIKYLTMYWGFITWYLFVIYSRSYGHLYVGNPPPFRVDEDVTFLIMPLNGDPNASPPVGQQPFPCKGYQVDLDGAGGEPVAQWTAGQDVTFSYVTRTTYELLTNLSQGSLIALEPLVQR